MEEAAVAAPSRRRQNAILGSDYDESGEEAEEMAAGDHGDETGGVEAGGETGGVDAAFEAVVTPGARIKMAMGRPAQWYGALVGKQRSDGNSVGFELGFDDGECRFVSIE